MARRPGSSLSAPLAVVGVMLAGVVSSGCKEPTGPEREISGATIFGRHCARCHGPDGRGLPEVVGVRDLTDRNQMGLLSDERIRGAIRMGRPPNMPSFGFFSEPTLKVLAAYVRQLSQPDLAPPPPPPDP